MRRLSILVCLFAILTARGWGQPTADLVLVNGKIVTVDSAFSIRSAMAVKDGRILAVGTPSEMEAYRGPSTRVLDLEGKTVLPGLIDSHTHPSPAAVFEYDHPVPEMESVADVLAYIRERAKVVPEGGWIWVSQVFLTRLKEQRYPTRAELDEAAPRHAVVFRTGPDASVNSLALQLSGIDENWKVDDGGPGYAEKDPDTGKLTGILRSCTRYLKSQGDLRGPTREERVSALKQLLADYNRVGITAVSERDAGPNEVTIYRELRSRDGLTCRAFLARHVESNQPDSQIEAEILAVRRSDLYRGDDLLRMRTIKMYLDGGMLTGSAFMRQPWGVSRLYGITDPGYRGLQFISDDRLQRILELCFRHEVQFTAHSVGDGAVHAFIDACAALGSRFDLRALRPVIGHSNFMSEEAVRRVAELGIPVDIQPAWLYLDGRTLTHHFGYERMAWFQPLRALFAAGAVAGGGSDHMQKLGSRRSINFYDPWLAMWVAMTRQARWLDRPLHPEHALSRVEAIRFYTINNAYLLLAEKDLGSLEPGKLADFIVLSTDILTCPLDRVPDIQVESTWVGGRQVWDRRTGAGSPGSR
ncbi:MAG: amidohydrolase [Acidobacteriota bacterium]